MKSKVSRFYYERIDSTCDRLLLQDGPLGSVLSIVTNEIALLLFLKHINSLNVSSQTVTLTDRTAKPFMPQRPGKTVR